VKYVGKEQGMKDLLKDITMKTDDVLEKGDWTTEDDKFFADLDKQMAEDAWTPEPEEHLLVMEEFNGPRDVQSMRGYRTVDRETGRVTKISNKKGKR
jgi:hypothetical protein